VNGTLVYKILTQEQWSLLERTGRFEGSPDDLRDGFIHLSLAEQVEATRRKHFQGKAGLVELTLEVSRLGSQLLMEPSGSGVLYPHLYRPLLLRDVLSKTVR